MEWNYSLDTAPKGLTREVISKNNKGESFVKTIHVKQDLWLLSRNNEVVLSYYIPKQERFNGFSKEIQPVAWQEFIKPEPPEKD